LPIFRHQTFLPAPAETEKAANEKAKKEAEKPQSKDKVRTAKKIQKDMEKWAKMLNQKKESQKVAVPAPTPAATVAAPSQKGRVGTVPRTCCRYLSYRVRYSYYVCSLGVTVLVGRYRGTGTLFEISFKSYPTVL